MRRRVNTNNVFAPTHRPRATSEEGLRPEPLMRPPVCESLNHPPPSPSPRQRPHHWRRTVVIYAARMRNARSISGNQRRGATQLQYQSCSCWMRLPKKRMMTLIYSVYCLPVLSPSRHMIKAQGRLYGPRQREVKNKMR